VARDFGTFLVSWVATRPDLSALVSSRVGPWQSGQSDTSAERITYQKVSGGNWKSLRGPSGVARERYQLNCLAPTQQRAARLAQLVKGHKNDRRLDGYSGTVGGVTVQACLLDDEREEPNAPAFGQQTPNQYAVQQDYQVAWEET
jgi:hypothetical protein